MAKGNTASKTVFLNNMKTTTTTKTVELIVKNGDLVPDTNDIEPGVNSFNLKN